MSNIIKFILSKGILLVNTSLFSFDQWKNKPNEQALVQARQKTLSAHAFGIKSNSWKSIIYRHLSKFYSDVVICLIHLTEEGEEKRETTLDIDIDFDLAMNPVSANKTHVICSVYYINSFMTTYRVCSFTERACSLINTCSVI